MDKIEYAFGTFSTNENAVPVPENLKPKDVRADPVAKACVHAANAVIEKTGFNDLDALSIVVVNREGCASHVKRISDGIARKVARQGFFARGGPQTLATYTALALGSHGATFTLVGDESAVDIALATAMHMANDGQSSGVLMTVVAAKEEGGFDAISALIPAQTEDHACGSKATAFNNIYNELVTVYQMEIGS